MRYSELTLSAQTAYAQNQWGPNQSGQTPLILNSLILINKLNKNSFLNQAGFIAALLE